MNVEQFKREFRKVAIHPASLPNQKRLDDYTLDEIAIFDKVQEQLTLYNEKLSNKETVKKPQIPKEALDGNQHYRSLLMCKKLGLDV